MKILHGNMYVFVLSCYMYIKAQNMQVFLCTFSINFSAAFEIVHLVLTCTSLELMQLHGLFLAKQLFPNCTRSHVSYLPIHTGYTSLEPSRPNFFSLATQSLTTL